MSETLKLSFHGAAGTVTGSKHLLTVGDTRILLDAGLFQGMKQLRLRNWDDPKFDPRSIDHVLLSHTHIDHVGYLPRLVKMGLRAPVYLTPAAYELAELMLLDSAHIQEEDARWANKKGFTKHKPAKPLYDTHDAREALTLRRLQRYNEWFELKGGVRARFRNAGHLLGSAFIELRVPSGGRELRIVFSGDIGRFAIPLHLDPKGMPECDVLIMESTYGNRHHAETTIEEQVGGPLREVLGNGGTVLIPAFAVGRSQQITLVLRRMMKAGVIPEVPIHIDSPMAVNATRIYSRFLNKRNIDPDVFEDGRLKLFPDYVHFHKRVSESMALNKMRGPRILVSSSGMLTAGRVTHHLARLAKDPKNMVLLCGYQAPGTRGRSLVDGAKELKIHGRMVPIRCRTEVLTGLSGHADQEELLRWVESAPSPPALTLLVHGEAEPAKTLAGELERRVGCRTHIPQLDEEFDLRPELEKHGRLITTAGEEAAERPLADVPEKAEDPLEDGSPEEDAPEAARRLLDSPAYQRADHDIDLLQRDELRATRLQIEYLKPELAFQEHEVHATIAVFGGTRIIDPASAEKKLANAKSALGRDPKNEEAQYAVKVAERILAKSKYYDVARDIGRLVGEAGHGPKDERLLVVTGGGPGVMEAANRGAHDVGAASIGLNITLPHEQFPNAYISPELCFQFRYFALRKMHFLMRARALVACPGGYGTFDELFETLCLIQTHTVEPLPVVLVGEEFWRGAVNIDFLADEGVISPKDKKLFHYAETAEETWKIINDWYRERGRQLIE